MTAVSPSDSISVVMIFRNAERFMDEAIRSVLSQTHQSIELLLCDDGSGDDSTAMAKQWQRRDPERVRYLEHPNHEHRGMSATRNLGVAAAGGMLLAFLDSDDVWLPHHLTAQLEALRAHPEVAAVCGTALSWRSWDGSIDDEKWSPLPWPSDTVVAPPDMLTEVLRYGGYSTPICSLMVRRGVVRKVGGSDDRFASMYEDQVLLAKIYLTEAIVLSDARTALYRQHEGSSSALAIRTGFYHPMSDNPSREAFLRWLQQQPQLQDDDLVGEPLRAALSAALRPYGRYGKVASRVRRQKTALKRSVRAALAVRARRLLR